MRFLTAFFVFFAALAAPVSAQERSTNVKQVIDRLVEGYGGDALREMRSVSIASNRRLGWLGQGQTATFVEFGPDRLRKHLNLANELGSVERWTLQNGNVYHNRYVVDAQGAQVIDYFGMTSSPSEAGGFWQWFSGDFRSSDALMAYRLAMSDITVRHAGTEFYLGHMHDRLAFSIVPDSLEITIYVSRTDGLIRRATMPREIGEVNFVFGAHRSSGGVTYASEIHIFVDDVLTEFEWDLAFSPNTEVAEMIAAEAGLSKPPEPVEQSKMTVDAIGEGVFLVGREDYSLFALDGDGVIAVNAYAGLAERHAALTEHLERDIPLTGMIVTHHHSDHMDSVAEAVGLGATLFVTGETDAVLKAGGGALSQVTTHVLAADEQVGPFSVFVRPTSHASQNTLVFHPDTRILFQDDHYHGLVADGPSRVQPTAIEIHDIVSELGLDVDRIASGHARKAERWEVFAAAVNQAGAGDLCPTGREICRSYQLR